MYWNSNSHDKILDPSQPISEKPASEEDRIESEHLYQTFLKDKYLSDISDPNHPAKIAFTNAINSLNNLLNTWIRGLGVQQGGDQNLIVRLVPYGSHRLEVSTIDGDVDALVLAPKFVERDKHFFGEFPSILKEDPNVTDVQTIKEAFVPLIKLKYQGLSIDLIFASLDTSSLDDKLEKLKDDSILMNMDAEMKRSVNGFRVAEKILESVKDLKTFRTTLKLVKLWAKSKSIYSNSIGYLGGISCAILVARICQMFPNFTPNKLLVNFFKFYSEWKWDVYQVHIAKTEWASEEGSAMVVVTPSYPSMNSTYNVSNTTLKVITGHLQESYNIIMRNPKEIDWKKIFDKYDFFKSYYHFFEITIGSDAETREPYIRWRSLVESKLRYFTKGFEFFDYHKQFDIRPYPIPFEQDNDSFKYEVSYYIGFKPNKDHMNISCKINFMPIAKEFFDNLALFKKKEDKIKILYKPREELPDVLFENKERPKWATKDWIESRRQISSEKSESEEVNSQSGQKNVPNFMPRQQNNFQFYPYPYGSQYIPNNANAQNNNFGPINYMYPPQYNNFQGQNQVIFQANNNANLVQGTGNRKPGGEGQGIPGDVGINGGNDNGNSDSISNS